MITLATSGQTDSQLKVLTPAHPEWEAFSERLEGVEGCNFHRDEHGEIVWKCYGGFDKRFSRAILEKIPGIDVELTLQYFTEHGGHCDCEVLFNVKDRSTDV